MFSRIFLVDLAERAIATYVEAFLGLLIVSGVTDLSTLRTAAVAAVPAGLSVVKAGLARLIGDRESASMSPEIRS